MEAVGQLTGGVAHDFNNLLAAIVPSLEIARDHIDNEVALKYVGHAAHAAARGAKLTHQLLNFAHKQDLVTRPIDVNQLIGNLCEMLPRTLGPTVEIKTVLDNRLWLALRRRQPARERDPEPGDQRPRRHAERRQADHRDQPTSSSTPPMRRATPRSPPATM